jgi:hypothetical protein
LRAAEAGEQISDLVAEVKAEREAGPLRGDCLPAKMPAQVRHAFSEKRV